MKRIFQIITLCLFAFPVLTMAKDVAKPVVGGSYKVVPVEELDNVSYQSVVYALPKTELQIEILTEKTTRICGPFYQYSDRYLGLKDVITEDVVNWELMDVHIETVGIPDETKRYAILFNGNSAAPYITNSKNGCIQSVNMTPKCEGLAVYEEKSKQSYSTNFDNVPYTEEMLIANSTAKMAEEAAAYIKKIRENRTYLISGEAKNTPADGVAFELALKKMDDLEQQFLELFKGKIITEVVSKHISYMPSKEIDRDVLFRFSKFNGLVPKEDLGGEPVTLGLKILSTVNLPDKKLEPELDSKGRVISSVPDAGLYYCMPGTIQIKMNYKGQDVYNGRLLVAQFGQYLNLPTSILQNPDQAIQFVPETGAIKAIIKK